MVVFYLDTVVRFFFFTPKILPQWRRLHSSFSDLCLQAEEFCFCGRVNLVVVDSCKSLGSNSFLASLLHVKPSLPPRIFFFYIS